VAREGHELERAVEYFEEALELARTRGDKYATGVRLSNLGVIAEQRGDIAAAIAYQEQAHAIALEIGDREGAALTEINLGQLAVSSGEFLHARNHLQHALKELLALNSISYLLYAVGAFAQLVVAQGDLGRGAELLGLALRHPSSTADIAIDFAPVIQEIEKRMDPLSAEAALTHGSAMDLRLTVMDLASGHA
jgi:tetratricopeptide (TPR) repeat protein